MYFSRLTAVYEMSNLIKETIICLEFFFHWRCSFWFLIFCCCFIYWHTFIPHFRKSTKPIFPVADQLPHSSVFCSFCTNSSLEPHTSSSAFGRKWFVTVILFIISRLPSWGTIYVCVYDLCRTFFLSLVAKIRLCCNLLKYTTN